MIRKLRIFWREMKFPLALGVGGFFFLSGVAMLITTGFVWLNLMHHNLVPDSMLDMTILQVHTWVLGILIAVAITATAIIYRGKLK